ncbi:alpha-N-arabinofuranosidase [Paenibacillus sp. UNCCL117]|uniref:alpha-L-arabinofuranosidase C-terminal domain-containing protein n=1 Tax=unclassified Paenibacillus TaxID=185978 RepID=UPI00088F0C12|nr:MULTISPECIES: alpha-L-arabinofuranosidase C-terminal domain-containing protein [unclassified Paenibacillus]SDD07789.1 alpha-N-arabinofuranosidase [Paenibacillus sp. cl123]SFW31371.1 alpha-N-arabinofuranosidase [Paenibacillus sp. UNCCL117]
MLQVKARIQVNANQVGKDRINPYLFGHFVEDIRDHMEAMLAHPLADMDFESTDQAYRGLSGGWRAYTNGKSTVYGLEPAAAYHSGHSQMIRIFSDDEAYAGICQPISVKRDPAGYALALYARASVEIKWLVAEIADKASGEVLGSARIPLSSGHTWAHYESRIALERDCEQAEFRLYVPTDHERWLDHVSTGMLWLDHVSLLPSDSAGYVRSEVMELTRELNAGMMRLAGNYISAYHWRQAVGPVYERPCVVNEAWGGWTNKYFGTDEFIRFCRELNVEPLICVNDGSGTPEEAAQWVEYCNGSADTPMGQLRAESGHAEPYGVKYWEIGNEVWGPWQVGHCSAEQFAERYVQFARAMKATDPGIKLMACGDVNMAWNRTVVERTAEYADYLTLHLYHGYPRFGMNERTPKDERYKAIVSFPEWTRESMRQVRELLGSDSRYSHLKVAITEYNTMYSPNTIRKGLPHEHTLEAAVANAANLNEMIRNADLVEIGSFSDLVNGWLGGCIRVGDFYADQFRGKAKGWSGKSLGVYGTPTYHVMKLYANRDLGHLVECRTESGTFQVNSAVPASVKLDELPELDVVASRSASGDKLTVFIVNRSLEPVLTEVELDGFAGSGAARLFEITADDYEAINSPQQPEAVVCTEREVPVSQGKATLELKASSVYALELSQ